MIVKIHIDISGYRYILPIPNGQSPNSPTFSCQHFPLYGTHVFDPKPGVCVHGLCVDGWITTNEIYMWKTKILRLSQLYYKNYHGTYSHQTHLLIPPTDILFGWRGSLWCNCCMVMINCPWKYRWYGSGPQMVSGCLNVKLTEDEVIWFEMYWANSSGLNDFEIRGTVMSNFCNPLLCLWCLYIWKVSWVPIFLSLFDLTTSFCTVAHNSSVPAKRFY